MWYHSEAPREWIRGSQSFGIPDDSSFHFSDAKLFLVSLELLLCGDSRFLRSDPSHGLPWLLPQVSVPSLSFRTPVMLFYYDASHYRGYVVKYFFLASFYPLAPDVGRDLLERILGKLAFLIKRDTWATVSTSKFLLLLALKAEIMVGTSALLLWTSGKVKRITKTPALTLLSHWNTSNLYWRTYYCMKIKPILFKPM